MTETMSSTLRQNEDKIYEVMFTSEDVSEVRDSMVASGLNHLRMEPSKLKLAFGELWTGMRGRSGYENLAITAAVAGYMFSGGSDYLSNEHAMAMRRHVDKH